MKALDILNEVNGQLKRSRDYNRFNIKIQFNKTYQVKVEEAIKELEDLQNRKCGNYKHQHSKKVDHPNCTLDDVYQGIEEINKIISFKNNFKDYGFEADFEGEILKQIGDILYGVVYVEYFGRGVVCEWNTKGKVISKYKIDEKAFELKPIKKEWYENPDNFPCLVIYESKEIKLMGSYSETSKFRTEPCLLTADGLVYHSLSKCRLATEEEALKLVKKG